MAVKEKAETTAPVVEEKKKRGVAKGTKRPSKFQTLGLKWEKGAADGNFTPVEALTALAQNLGLIVSTNESKKRGTNEGTGKFTLVISATPITKRAKSVIGKDKEKDALAIVRAMLRDPEKGPQLSSLLEAAKGGADNSAEIQKMLGISA